MTFDIRNNPNKDLIIDYQLMDIINISQKVDIYANGTIVFSGMITEKDNSFIIPAELVKDGKLTIMFVLPYDASFKYFSESDDERNLTLAFSQMTINEVSEEDYANTALTHKYYTLGKEIEIFTDDRDLLYFRGLHGKEDGFSWSTNSLLIGAELQDTVNEDITCEIKLADVITPDQTVQVLVNDKQLFEFDELNRDSVITFKIPKYMYDYNYIKVILLMPNAVRPSDTFDGATDERILSVAIKAITFK